MRFRTEQYKDAEDATASDYVAGLLDADEPVMRIATYLQMLRRYTETYPPGLYDRVIDAIPVRGCPDIQIWVYTTGSYHLIYSYWAQRNEVLFLEVINGSPGTRLADTRERIRNFYQLP